MGSVEFQHFELETLRARLDKMSDRNLFVSDEARRVFVGRKINSDIRCVKCSWNSYKKHALNGGAGIPRNSSRPITGADRAGVLDLPSYLIILSRTCSPEA
jgi:hypothetical protein